MDDKTEETAPAWPVGMAPEAHIHEERFLMPDGMHLKRTAGWTVSNTRGET